MCIGQEDFEALSPILGAHLKTMYPEQIRTQSMKLLFMCFCDTYDSPLKLFLFCLTFDVKGQRKCVVISIFQSKESTRLHISF